jgi:hypothetical protein
MPGSSVLPRVTGSNETVSNPFDRHLDELIDAFIKVNGLDKPIKIESISGAKIIKWSENSMAYLAMTVKEHGEDDILELCSDGSYGYPILTKRYCLKGNVQDKQVELAAREVTMRICDFDLKNLVSRNTSNQRLEFYRDDNYPYWFITEANK